MRGNSRLGCESRIRLTGLKNGAGLLDESGPEEHRPTLRPFTRTSNSRSGSVRETAASTRSRIGSGTGRAATRLSRLTDAWTTRPR